MQSGMFINNFIRWCAYFIHATYDLGEHLVSSNSTQNGKTVVL